MTDQHEIDLPPWWPAVRLASAGAGVAGLIALACHWASMGYMVAACIALAAALGWLAAWYPPAMGEHDD